MSATGAPKRRPNSLWLGASSLIMGLTGGLFKGFLNAFNEVEVIGLQRFLELLDSRKDIQNRQRGLITVSNHISVLDDPLIWGVLPMKNMWNPSNLRWGLGAHDICFQNKLLATFFTAGQVLPTHRSVHSPHGGLFQASITQAIRLLSAYPFSVRDPSGPPPGRYDLPDPFSGGSLTYTTMRGADLFVAPSAYLSNRHSWVHIFPEGGVHQHAERSMRYFKWGVARLILEAEPLPDLVPMFIDGTADVMPEDRAAPRFVPRTGKKIRVAFGEKVDAEALFGDLRRRWQGLVSKSMQARAAVAAAAAVGKEKAAEEVAARKDGKEAKGAVVQKPRADLVMMGELSDDLKYGKEAEEIRIEVARRVRNEVVKLRKSLGYPDEDPRFGLAETWARDPKTKAYRSPVDGSLNREE
ncbi:Lysophosphatidylcholine acyltransferase [Pleurostoma richardsiae]|uniref:Tafazzin family protein n=1 Tax=Pleurostoma richardsiae TaxID=41990 RepID=A0AA38VIH3_9PEZI|nr:Lysophosphatidylcholine acyltransferase [Pleurostoma richardsiae]